MKLISELLASHVIDAEGQEVGSVHDVRLVQDGPFIEGFGASLRVDGLVAGVGTLAVRFGYHRHQVKGPALLKALLGALERRGRFIPWSQVAEWDGSTVRLHCRAADLATLAEAYAR
jgi:hypothetical protein